MDPTISILVGFMLLALNSHFFFKNIQNKGKVWLINLNFIAIIAALLIIFIAIMEGQ